MYNVGMARLLTLVATFAELLYSTRVGHLFFDTKVITTTHTFSKRSVQTSK